MGAPVTETLRWLTLRTIQTSQSRCVVWYIYTNISRKPVASNLRSEAKLVTASSSEMLVSVGRVVTYNTTL
jgi:hypothetical protein